MKTLAFANALLAMLASEPLEDPGLESRAQGLMREIRCVACENEPVSQSAAPIAEDMRARIREMIEQGASDDEVRAWFRARYGAHALFRPPANHFGWLLWGAPFVLLGVGVAAALGLRGGGRETSPEAVSPETLDSSD